MIVFDFVLGLEVFEKFCHYLVDLFLWVLFGDIEKSEEFHHLGADSFGLVLVYHFY